MLSSLGIECVSENARLCPVTTLLSVSESAHVHLDTTLLSVSESAHVHLVTTLLSVFQRAPMCAQLPDCRVPSQLYQFSISAPQMKQNGLCVLYPSFSV